MTEPVSTSALGVKLGWALAGLAGGIVSLSFLKNLNRWQAFLAFFTGGAAANYLTAVACGWLNVSNEQYQYGVAFVIGVCAMNIIPAIQMFVGKFIQHKSEDLGVDK